MLDYEVRDGQRVAPTCPECGCRLHSIGSKERPAFSHFYGYRADAQGHNCKYLSVLWLTNEENKTRGISTNSNHPYDDVGFGPKKIGY